MNITNATNLDINITRSDRSDSLMSKHNIHRKNATRRDIDQIKTGEKVMADMIQKSIIASIIADIASYLHPIATYWREQSSDEFEDDVAIYFNKLNEMSKSLNKFKENYKANALNITITKSMLYSIKIEIVCLIVENAWWTVDGDFELMSTGDLKFMNLVKTFLNFTDDYAIAFMDEHKRH